MAILVISLSCMPCDDGAALMTGDKAQCEFVKNTDTNQSDEHFDHCSPFCYCSCCSTSSLNSYQPIIANISTLGQKHTTPYLPDNRLEVYLPIWQPPRVNVI